MEAGEAGLRIDVFLTLHLTGVGRRAAQKLIDAGDVRINGHRVAKSMRLQAGDQISVQGEVPQRDFVALADLSVPLEVVYEDAWLVAIDKPAGMACHPLLPSETGTVANALLARYPEMARVGYAAREPGLLHRLDRETSGLLLAARDASTFAALRRALQNDQLDKRYLALCRGTVGDEAVKVPGIIALPMTEMSEDGRKMRLWHEGERLRGKRQPLPARTELLTAHRHGDWSLLEIRLRRGQRHQIRAHLAGLGHPLYGDVLYDAAADKQLGRHFLHADHIDLLHPQHGEMLSLHAPLPAALQAVLQRLAEA